MDRQSALTLKARLERSWPVFFAAHGNFTAIQLAAIPKVLDGHNVVMCAATAGGKTEAALAPLIERYAAPNQPGLRILYIVPTRALINDLTGRLAHKLERLRVSFSVKSRDLDTFSADHPSNILFITPEAVDSLLTANARALAEVRAIVLDELHLLDGTPRGDQLRIVLNRVRIVREYAERIGDSADSAMQYVALSATLADPGGAAARYFPNPQVVVIPGSRPIKAESVPLEPDNADALIEYLYTFRQRGWRRALVFCNSRAEVEQYAQAIRGRSPFGDAVFVHYSNLDAHRRRDIERQFAQADAALCFASSTLELGIDIGDLDAVLLIGPPGTLQSFVQRIGRASRRADAARTILFYRTDLERLTFEALLQGAIAGALEIGNPAFRPSVAIQQVFSLIKQSQTASVRLAELTRLFDATLTPADVEMIIGRLQELGYLRQKRAGEWCADTRLNKLYDAQNALYVPQSIYSNIQSLSGPPIRVRDQHTQQVIAAVDSSWLSLPGYTLEGRSMQAEWFDGESLWVSAIADSEMQPRPIYRAARQMLSFEVAQQIKQLSAAGETYTPLVQTDDGWLYYHCLGDLYGLIWLELLRGYLPVTVTDSPGLTIHVAAPPGEWPAFSAEQVVRCLEQTRSRWETLLPLGVYHRLLPGTLRFRTVVEQFNIPRFIEAVNALTV
ncbi:MAG: DEAD/DEAH box helicase [Aggregatilineales bacterium]